MEEGQLCSLFVSPPSISCFTCSSGCPGARTIRSVGGLEKGPPLCSRWCGPLTNWTFGAGVATSTPRECERGAPAVEQLGELHGSCDPHDPKVREGPKKKTSAERPWGSNSALDPSIWVAQGGESAVGGRFVEAGRGSTYRFSCFYMSLKFSTPPPPPTGGHDRAGVLALGPS